MLYRSIRLKLYPLMQPGKKLNTQYWRGALLALAMATPIPVSAKDEINFYNLSFTPSLQNLLKNMVERALELTEEDYGPYNLNYSTLPASLERLCKDSQEGKIDIFFTAHRPKEVESCGAFTIETNLLNKAMGLRLITVHKDNAEKFSHIQTLNDLRQFAMGIGHSWEENKILAKYNLPLEIAILNSSLLPMLEKKRFDYLATSSLDKLTYASLTYIYNNENLAGLARRTHTERIDELVTLDDFFIYYPVPMEIHLSQRNATLAERLKAGAERFAKSGDAKKMVNEVIRNIKISKNKTIRLVLLDNPLFDAEKNQRYKDNFLAEMPNNITVLPH